MKKTFELEDLDCANCARKMQEAVEKLDGVNSCSVNFMTQKMILDADDAKFDIILQEAIKVMKKVEPDCTVVL
ncbi:MAG: heavy-metal-associated domain-containing protein [Saccharofermentans sp.]|jgi:copper chaperone CopZ|nr:heavy-metal-associated domain-containing protein [Saccharofermentans sp.]